MTLVTVPPLHLRHVSLGTPASGYLRSRGQQLEHHRVCVGSLQEDDLLPRPGRQRAVLGAAAPPVLAGQSFQPPAER